MTRYGRRGAFALAVLVHLLVLYTPTTGGVQPGVPHLDKVVHVAVFAAVAWTGLRAGVPACPLTAVLVAHAVLSEVIQGLLLHARAADPWDTVADLAGVAVGLLLSRTTQARTVADRG